MRSWARAVGVLVCTAGLVACTTADDGAEDTDAGSETVDDLHECLVAPDHCTLRQVAETADIDLGAAVSATRLGADPEYDDALATHYTSLTPENAMKWTTIEPVRGARDFSDADAMVEFAARNGMTVRGHTLLWAEESTYETLPAWVGAITDPEELRAVLRWHITDVVTRYARQVDRWDVVNEPLLLLGDDLDPNHLWTVLGPDYISEAFHVAHEADPDASLWLNEHSGELVAGKADALVELVADLVAQGVPIDGVGIQGHYLSGRPPEVGALGSLVEELTDLGVEVAITELDVPVLGDDDLELQADAFARIVTECLDAGCVEITAWGVYDGQTWLDDFLADDAPTRPLLLDHDFRPKPAYDAVRAAIADHVSSASGRAT